MGISIEFNNMQVAKFSKYVRSSHSIGTLVDPIPPITLNLINIPSHNIQRFFAVALYRVWLVT